MTGFNVTLSVDEVADVLDAGTHLVIDMNSPQRFARGHLPGALNVGREELTRILPDRRDAPLLFYCGSSTCSVAPDAARYVASLGYTRVNVLAAGIAGWEEAGLRTVTA